MSPFALKSRNGNKIVAWKRSLIVKTGMRTEEVVIGDKESCQSNGTNFRSEAVGGLGVEFVSAVEAFYKLFKRPKFS